MAFYFALMNVSNKRSDDKGRQSQRHSRRHARRHSIASVEEPLNDYRLLPKPLVMKNELAKEHLPLTRSTRDDIFRLRDSSISSRDETPPPTTEFLPSLKDRTLTDLKQLRLNQLSLRRESSDTDEPTCSRRLAEMDRFNTREDSASGEEDFRSSIEESRRTSKASTVSSEILIPPITEMGPRNSKLYQNSETSQGTNLVPIVENKAIIAKRVTFDSSNNSVIIGNHFLGDRTRLANAELLTGDSRPAAQQLCNQAPGTKKEAAGGASLSAPYSTGNLSDTPIRTILQNATNEHAEREKEEEEQNKGSRLVRRRSTSDRGASFCNRGFMLLNEELGKAENVKSKGLTTK
ncbi:unnamed protein product, partial [Mesorhabditis spiculigera]